MGFAGQQFSTMKDKDCMLASVFFCVFITPTFLTGYKIDIGGISEATRRHLGGNSEATRGFWGLLG